MEKSHRCKFCFRNFANGRALGGHMRSHMMKFFAEKKVLKEGEGEENPFDDDEFQSVHSYSSPSSSSSEEEDDDGSQEVKALMSYELRENPKRSALLVDHEFSSVVLQDRESETESSKKNPICKRSKRARKSRISDFNGFSFFEMKKSKYEDEGKRNGTNENSTMVEPEPLSSISDTTPEEHVAHCLIMLSKDKWKRDEIEYQQDEGEEAEKLGDDYSEDSGVEKVVKTKVRGKYRCEACNKLFRSYQALGGHRASHKKIKAAEKVVPKAAAVAVAAPAVVEEKIHECPFCHRIFSSGQALGGHKRSHFIGGSVSANINTTSPVKRHSNTLKIDLNLPAPTDDDDNSQIAVSAVSDAEFVHPPIKQ